MPALEEGQMFERYRIIRLLGRGVSAESYEAEDAMLLRKVVLKLIHPWSTLPDSARRQFFREMQGISMLNHPYLAATLDYGELDGRLYAARRFLSSGSLLSSDGRLWFNPPLGITEAIRYGHQLAQALAYIHSLGYLHGALTLANILVLRGPNVDHSPNHAPFLLADVGLANFVRRFGRPQITTLPITAAPEQLGKRVTAASDQFALAVILYFWITGRPPYLGTPEEVEQAKLSESITSLISLNPRVSFEQEGIMRRALSVYPEERYPSILAFANALLATTRPRPATTPLPELITHPEPVAQPEPAPVEQPAVAAAAALDSQPEQVAPPELPAEPQPVQEQPILYDQPHPEPALVVEERRDGSITIDQHQSEPEHSPSAEIQEGEPVMIDRTQAEPTPAPPVVPGSVSETMHEAPPQPQPTAAEVPSLQTLLQSFGQPTAVTQEQKVETAEPEPVMETQAPPAYADTPVSQSEPALSPLLEEQPRPGPTPVPTTPEPGPTPLPDPYPGPTPIPTPPPAPGPTPETEPEPIPVAPPLPSPEPEPRSGSEPIPLPRSAPGTEPITGEVEAPVAAQEEQAKPAMLFARLIIRPPAAEEAYEFSIEREEVTLGRAGSSDILLDQDTLTSRHHALLKHEDDHYIIYDRRSANGVFVNGQQVSDDGGSILADGDHISIGNYELIFRIGTSRFIDDKEPANSGAVLP